MHIMLRAAHIGNVIKKLVLLLILIPVKHQKVHQQIGGEFYYFN